LLSIQSDFLINLGYFYQLTLRFPVKDQEIILVLMVHKGGCSKAVKKVMKEKGLRIRKFYTSSDLEYAYVKRITTEKGNLGLRTIVALCLV